MRREATIDKLRGSDIVEIRVDGGQYLGLELSDFTKPLTPEARSFATFRPTPLATGPVKVPKDFLWLTMENVGCGTNQAIPPWDYGIEFGCVRILGQGTYRAEIESVARGSYNWAKLDAVVAEAERAGKSIALNVAYTPSNSASNANAHRSAGFVATAGWASAPDDLSATNLRPGAPNSVTASNFYRALARRYKGRIQRYIFWNEPNYRRYQNPAGATQEVPHFNWLDTSDDAGLLDATTARSSVSGNQNYVQFVLCQADFYSEITQEDPDAIVIGPDFFGEGNSQSTGGKVSGREAFNRWLVAGGANWCHAYGWHAYMDEYFGMEGVSKRLTTLLDGLETDRAAAGAPALPRYNTETGHEQLGKLPLEDQKRWLWRQAFIHAAKGFQSWCFYAWDSFNPSTTQMSLWGPPHLPNSGLRELASEFSRIGRVIPDSTITNPVILNNGMCAGAIDGVPVLI